MLLHNYVISFLFYTQLFVITRGEHYVLSFVPESIITLMICLYSALTRKLHLLPIHWCNIYLDYISLNCSK